MSTENMTLTQKVSYIKGLAEGLSIDEAKPENKILTALIEVITDIADELECTNADIESLYDLSEEIDKDLGALEADVYEIDEAEDDGEYEITCPHCETDIIVDDDMLDDGAAECPECGKEIDLNAVFEEFLGGCDCDCGCDCGCEEEDK